MTANSEKPVITYRPTKSRFKEILNYAKRHDCSRNKALDLLLDEREEKNSIIKKKEREIKELKESQGLKLPSPKANTALNIKSPNDCYDMFQIVGEPALRECGLKPKDRPIYLPKRDGIYVVDNPKKCNRCTILR